MKKLLSIMMAVFLVIGLAACKQNNGSMKDQQSGATSPNGSQQSMPSNQDQTQKKDESSSDNGSSSY